eukprot:4738217-Prymnesium_polylepis.1
MISRIPARLSDVTAHPNPPRCPLAAHTDADSRCTDVRPIPPDGRPARLTPSPLIQTHKTQALRGRRCAS